MKKTTLSVVLVFLVFSLTRAQQTNIFNPENISIAYKKFVLDNGLTLIVHEDHKAPIDRKSVV